MVEIIFGVTFPGFSFWAPFGRDEQQLNKPAGSSEGASCWFPAQLQDGEVVNIRVQALPWLQINAHTHTLVLDTMLSVVSRWREMKNTVCVCACVCV